VSWNIIIPIMVAPVLLWTVVTLLPFLESWITGDKREHHLLQRPRNAPTRTAFMVALMTFYGIAWAAGGNDIIAVKMHLSINQITYAFRVLIFLGPLIAFVITRRWCISLQRADDERLMHGHETGVVVRSPEGGYSEKHFPVSDAKAYVLTAHERGEPLGPAHKNDANGVPEPGYPLRALRARLSQLLFADNVPKLTAEQLEAAREHIEHEMSALDAQLTEGTPTGPGEPVHD
jgi:ubiquinol-cytochrome c reductase cytochrome b subunit